MHHARSAQLDPAGVLADAATRTIALEAGVVHLRARLCEGEVRGPEARPRLRPEQLMHELCQRALQGRHRDAAINAQPFDLEEHRIVRIIRRVAAKDATGCDSAQWRS